MWACVVMRDMAFLCVEMATTFVLLSFFFHTGTSQDCRASSDLSITTPQTMEALNGSCLLIPCNFSSKGQQDFSIGMYFGVWIRNNPFFGDKRYNVIYNSSQSVNPYPMNITGNLRQRDCTTVFSHMNATHSDTYYFRIDGEFLATALCENLRITVEDSPRRPKMEIPGDLKEKESVTITCSAFTPCPHSPPQLTWNLQQGSRNYRENNKDGTFTTKIQETITLSDNYDGKSITCSAKYPVDAGKDVKTAEETKTLSVSYSPKDTEVSISPSGLVSAGDQVNLTCSSRANPPVSHFIWFKSSKDGAMKVSEGEIYIFNLTDEGGDYYCVALNRLGNQTSKKIHLPSQDFSETGALIGGIVGGILLIFLIVGLVLTCGYWRWLRASGSSQQSLYRTGEELSDGEPTGKAEEDIQYGEIDFSKIRAGHSSHSGLENQQETLYAQVKGSGFAKPGDGSEDVYAQVKMK